VPIFKDIISNKYITVPVLAWFIAQILKVINVIIKDKKMDFTRLIGSGGMPSSHSAFVVALAIVTGKNHGFYSAEFGITSALAIIVMYDAAGVRRAAGKQAEVLNMIIYSSDNINIDEKLKELLGHTPFEVLMGALLGALLGAFLG